jgi:ADP-ribosyl-[dinitrogen reductase] hydrolase
MSLTPSTYSRLKGCFLGLAIGDAMGAPVEFKSPDEFEPLMGYRTGGVHDVSLGEWTDDMAMALAISDSLIQHQGQLVLTSVLDNFILWSEEGKFSSRGDCFDIGNTCARALRFYKESSSTIASTTSELESGNGSLMRMAPIFVLFHDDIEVLILKCLDCSRTTHASPLVDFAVINFATLVFSALKGQSKDDILKCYTPNPNATPTGFVEDSLDVAFMAFRDTKSFEEGLLHVVNQGHDADTVGAIYGQLAGAFYGIDQIPASWKKDLWQLSMLDEVFEKLWNLRKT